jgi:hypothetical protein
VAVVRLPRVAHPELQPAPESKDDVTPLVASGLVRLHQMGQKGKGTRLAVVDSDFRGWEALAKEREGFPTRLVDFTRERNRDLEPDKFAGPADQVGHGTRCALAVLKAAPEVDLTLIRVDPATPYMVQAVAQSICGEPYRSLTLAHRQEDLDADRQRLNQRQEKLLQERAEALDQFADYSQKKFIEEFLKKNKEEDLNPELRILWEKIKKRDAYLKNQADFERDERAYLGRVRRFLDYQQALRDLKGIRVVTSSLVWNDGYPVDGSSPLSRYLDDRPFRAALWFQSAGDTRGQGWAGLFRDADRNDVMEFSAPEAKLPEGMWTRELNFLAWQPAAGKRAPDLPANVKVRISLQWREAHDDTFVRIGEDPFREPLTNLKLVVMRQLDPEGAKQPADDLEVITEFVGPPYRLALTPNSGTYEQVIELRIVTPGRYALRVEGRLPESDRPRNAPTLPSQRKTPEMRPRLFLETLEGPGRVLFQSYATETADIGMPGDAHHVLTVGAADPAGKPRPYSARGAHNLDLLVKPDVLAFDQVLPEGQGPGLASAFAAGLAAVAREGNAPVKGYLDVLGVPPGGLLCFPPGWPRR